MPCRHSKKCILFFDQALQESWGWSGRGLTECTVSSYASRWARLMLIIYFLEHLHWQETRELLYHHQQHSLQIIEQVRKEERGGYRWSQSEAGCGFVDYIKPSAHIFTLFSQKKHIFSLLSARKPQRGSHSISDCCTRLIRLIRFFSAEDWSLTRRDSRPLHHAPWWVWMRLYIQ